MARARNPQISLESDTEAARSTGEASVRSPPPPSFDRSVSAYEKAGETATAPWW